MPTLDYASFFGRRLREERKRRGFTQVQLSEKTDLLGSRVHAPDISSLERGGRRGFTPSVSTLITLAGALDIPLVAFFIERDALDLLDAYAEGGDAGALAFLAQRVREHLQK